MIEDKLRETKVFVEALLKRYRNPVLMCSFGKDSMVLAHILKERRFPVLFHRDPWFPKKYEFANQVISDWDLTVFDYPPSLTSLWQGKEIVAFTNHYQIGARDGKPTTLQLPKNIIPPTSGEKFLCGLKDLLGRPTGYFNYPWDLVLLGHKSSDEDQIAGKVPLKCDIKQNNGAGPDAAFPLRNWTDSDIWEYTELFDLPIQLTRYEKVGGAWREKADKTYNSDYWSACIACCDRREGATVRCPILNAEVSNVSATVRYENPIPDYCNDES